MDSGVVAQVRAAGGEVFAIISEPQHLADQAYEHWDLNFLTVGDPHQEIPRTCSERNWLTLYASKGGLDFLQKGADWKIEHPNGFFQPGVLALTGSGRVLYRWRSLPSAENLNGTVARPTPEHAWRRIERSLAAGHGAADAAHDDCPEIDRGPPPRLVFIAALVANGWFLGVKSFMYSPDAEPVQQRFAAVVKRWALFILAWVAALVLLPLTPVVLGFTCWLAWILRDVQSSMASLGVQQEIKAREKGWRPDVLRNTASTLRSAKSQVRQAKIAFARKGCPERDIQRGRGRQSPLGATVECRCTPQHNVEKASPFSHVKIISKRFDGRLAGALAQPVGSQTEVNYMDTTCLKC